MIKRIQLYFLLKKMGIHYPWRASGDRQFVDGFGGYKGLKAFRKGWM